MANIEGARRMVLLGKVIVMLGVTIGALIAFLLWGQPIMLLGGAIGLYTAGFGGLLWAAGWIVHGFLREPPRRG